LQSLSPEKAQIVMKQSETLLNIELGTDGRIDDPVIHRFFDHRLYPEESLQYINIKTNEKMIVNLL